MWSRKRAVVLYGSEWDSPVILLDQRREGQCRQGAEVVLSLRLRGWWRQRARFAYGLEIDLAMGAVAKRLVL